MLRLWGRSAGHWMVQKAEVCVWFCFSSDKNLPVTLNFESIAIHGLKDIIARLLSMLSLSAELTKQHQNFHYLQNLFLTFLINGQDMQMFPELYCCIHVVVQWRTTWKTLYFPTILLCPWKKRFLGPPLAERGNVVMEKVVKDGETPAQLIIPKTRYCSPNPSLVSSIYLNGMQLLKSFILHIYQLSEENIYFFTVFRKECLVKHFTLSLHCTYSTLCIFEPKDSSAFWFDF